MEFRIFNTLVNHEAIRFSKPLFGSGLLVENGDLQILIDRSNVAASLAGGHIDFEGCFLGAAGLDPRAPQFLETH